MFSTYANIIGKSGQLPPPAIDAQTIQQIQSNALALQKQQQDAQAQNALAKLYQNPANVQNGMLTQNALAQVMGIDPATGIALQQQQLKTKDAQVGVASDQQSYLASNVLTPAMEAYQNALKTMPQTAAMQVAQQVYSASLSAAKSSGVFSSDQSDQMPQNFDPNRIGGALESYSDFQKQQEAQSALAVKSNYDDQIIALDNAKLAPAYANAGLAPPGGGGTPSPAGYTLPEGVTPPANPLAQAILGNEDAGGGSNNAVSVNGAVGPMQMQPATFQQFAKPGESITNPQDNVNVGNRAIEAYQKQFNGDDARVAVAYFSGPGNVAPPGSPTPWIKNTTDGNGASVSGYVSKVMQNLGNATDASPAAAPPAAAGAAPITPIPGYSADATKAMVQSYLQTGKEPNFGGGGIGRRQKEAFYDAVGKAQANGAGSADPSAQGVAQMIAGYELPPLTSMAMRSPWGQQVMAQVQKLNPNYDETQFAAKSKAVRDFDTGTLGNSLRSFNVGISHLTTLGQLAGALQNGSVQKVNQIANAVAEQTGNPAPTNFDAAKAIVGDEIIKAIVGGGGALADRENAQNQIDNAKSPEQLMGVIETYKKLMAGQLGGLQQQFTSSTGLPVASFDAKLYPETLEQLKSDQAGTAPASGQTPAPPAVGTVMQGYRFNGGDPADPSSWSKV